MVADALYLYTNCRPLVINHDSLAPFICPTRTRPLLVKLHGDHRLTPRNTDLETDCLEKGIKQRVSMALHDRGLIFMGYGGADRGVLEMLDSLPSEAIPYGVYWVSRREPQDKIREWLLNRNGVWVKSGDFDETMLLICNEFKLPHPNEQRFKRIFDDYQKKFRELSEKIDQKPEKEPNIEVLKKAVANAEDAFPGYWKIINKAQKFEKKDPELAELIYEQGIKDFPDAAILLGCYADFLSDQKKDYDKAEAMYERAIAAEPNNANSLGSYANFLSDQKKDYDKAEAMYEQAIAVKPNHVRNLGLYSVFLSDQKNDYEKAEEMYECAIAADPNHADNLGNYTKLLFIKRKDERACELLRQAEEKQNIGTALQLELAFYRYAHCQPHDLQPVRKLLQEGARSPGWSLAGNVKRAREDGRPHGDLLAAIAAVISEEQPIETLEQFPEWTSAD